MLSILKTTGSIILDAIFPLFCKICSKPLNSKEFVCICRNCWNSITFLPSQVCVFCGMPMFPETSHLFKISHRQNHESSSEKMENIKKIACNFCIKKKPVFSSAHSVGLYNGAFKDIIHIFKFQPKPGLSKQLANLFLLSSQLKSWYEQDLTLMPIPIHNTKRRERGFNQAELLAEEINKKTGLEINTEALIKTKATAPQTELKAKERWDNVRGSFKVINPQHIENKKIMLVDDVLTTGATASEASLMLLKAGAKEVKVLTLARGTLQHKNKASC